MAAARKRQVYEARAGLVRPELLLGLVAHRRRDLAERTAKVAVLAERAVERKGARLDALAGRLRPSLARIVGPFLGSFLYGLHPSHALPFAAAVGLLAAVTAVVPRVSRSEGRP